YIVFFFSSRRRHTRFSRDWSSDVCSSDLFGREQSGLSNEELQRCHLHTQIPANPGYSSLNLAAAVQVISYELRLASLDTNASARSEERRVGKESRSRWSP